MKGAEILVFVGLGWILLKGWGGRTGGVPNLGFAGSPGQSSWWDQASNLTATQPSQATVSASGGPEVFQNMDAATAISSGLLGGRTYQDMPGGWSQLDWNDYLAGF